MLTLASTLVRNLSRGSWLTAAILVGCGGDEFSSAASGGSAGTAGATQGGSGGSTGGGGAGAGGAAGQNGGSAGTVQGGGSGTGGSGAGGSSGGGGSPACNCPQGQYCQVTTSNCRACSDLSRLAFATPERIATVSASAAGQQRFPRVGATDMSLFYRAGAPGSERIWQTADYTAGYGNPIAGSNGIDSGPLFLGSNQPNFWFDRVEGSSRHIVSASVSGGTLENLALAPTPLNPSSAGSSDYSVAIAAAPGGSGVPRAFWMTTRSGDRARLVTALLTGADVPVSDVALNIENAAGSLCGRPGDDATPWVTPGGDLLLFRAFPMDENCNPSDGDATDLYASILDPTTGQPPPLGAAIPLADVNRSTGNSTETDPSLSPDLCALYFASDSGQGAFDFDIFRANRH
jgi:hypothetical protein